MDHDLLIQIDTKLTSLTDTVRDIVKNTNIRLDKHDNEIDSLQKFRWLLIGGLAVAEFVIHALLRF